MSFVIVERYDKLLVPMFRAWPSASLDSPRTQSVIWKRELILVCETFFQEKRFQIYSYSIIERIVL